MIRHDNIATFVAALLVSWNCFASPSVSAAATIQLTQPAFTPADGIQFGLHRLPQSSPHPDLVTFSSHSAALVDNDTNNLPDVFVWSRSTGKVQLISVGTNGPANGASFDPALSKDGRFVAFVSSASNFLTDTNKLEDVYLANIATGELELISVPLKGGGGRLGMTRNAVISEDGRYVAYSAARSDLITGTSTREHVLIRDRQGAETIWANSTLEANIVPARPVALRESRLWFFSSTNLYRFDLDTRALTNLCQSSSDPSFTSDGSKVAAQIVSSRTNFVAWYDAATRETNIVFTGATNRTLRYDSVSIADNGAVAFMAAKLDDTNRIADVYVALPGGDPANPAAPTLVSAMPTPPDSTVFASSPLISPDGARIYFKYTTVSKLNSATHVDLYMRDLSSATPQLVASGAYFSKMIRTPTGPLVIGGSGDFSFATPSDETDLALLPYPPATSPRMSLQIGQTSDGWRISFHKIPNVAPKVQSADVLDPNAWTDLSIAPQDGGPDWIVTDPATANQRFYRLLVSP